MTDKQRDALEAARAALMELSESASLVKTNLDASIPLGDPVHPESARLTWPLSTAGLALAQIDEALAGAPARQPTPRCACGDRSASACPGEWEPGCDLGANEKYVVRYSAPLVPTDEIVMTKAELKEYTDHIAELERALAGGDFPDDCSSCPNNPTNYPPSGFKLVAVKGFDDLVSALERASRKGYMPDAMVDEWEAFEIAIGHATPAADHAAQPEQPAKLTDEQPHALCQPNGLMFDFFGEPRTRYVRVSLGGSHCAMRPSEGDTYLSDAREAGDESPYVVRDVYLSEREFNDLPEFNGF